MGRNGRPSPPNGYHTPVNGRPSPPGGMRQPVPRHPPGQGNSVAPQQVEQYAGVSALHPPKGPMKNVRSLTGSVSASAGSGESAHLESEPSANSSQSSFGPRPPMGVRWIQPNDLREGEVDHMCNWGQTALYPFWICSQNLRSISRLLISLMISPFLFDCHRLQRLPYRHLLFSLNVFVCGHWSTTWNVSARRDFVDK